MEESRPQQTKHIAQRIDITYHRRPTWFKLWRRWVAVLTVVVVGIIVAVAAVSMLHGGRGERWLNPGPVSSAHAHFENKCAECHDNGGKGGFSKVVSDAACLKCHDATPHAKSASHFVSADSMHSTSCTACHVEHRGHAAAVASDNRLCSQCHADLSQHLAAGKTIDPGFAAHVTRFTTADHPPFGRKLLAAGVPLAPTTQKSSTDRSLPGLKLKFNHATHFNPGKMNGKTLACADCHVPTRPDPKGLESAGSMKPVSYEQSCRRCHPIVFEFDFKKGELFKGGHLSLQLPHGDPQIVRAPLLDLAAAIRPWLVSDPVQMDAAMHVDDDAVERSLDYLKNQILEKFSDSVSTGYEKAADRIKKTEKLKDGSPRADQLDALTGSDSKHPATSQPAAVAEYIVFNKTTYTCTKCHEVQGDLAAIYYLRQQWRSLKQVPPSTPVPLPLYTTPTGVTSTPRRWLTSSRFDHEAHRDQTCESCHVGIKKDEDDFLRLPSIESCVVCHHSDTSASRGATSACTACHDYHMR